MLNLKNFVINQEGAEVVINTLKGNEVVKTFYPVKKFDLHNIELLEHLENTVTFSLPDANKKEVTILKTLLKEIKNQILISQEEIEAEKDKIPKEDLGAWFYKIKGKSGIGFINAKVCKTYTRLYADIVKDKCKIEDIEIIKKTNINDLFEAMRYAKNLYK